MPMRRRKWIVALALVAMLFGGLRSLCDAAGADGSALHTAMVSVASNAALAHAPQGGGDAPDCCANAASTASPAAFDPWLSAASNGKLAVFLVLFLLATASFTSLAATAPYRLVPRSLSFYLRSARILR